MNKLNEAWTVFIVISCSIVVASVFYCLYRLYIDQIYKRKRAWAHLSSRNNRQSNETFHHRQKALTPRKSIVPLVEDYLTSPFQREKNQRIMATKLQFSEPPDFIVDFQKLWNDFDTQSSRFSRVHTDETMKS